MIRGIDHIGIAVRALEDALPFWSKALGLPVGGFETVATERVKVAFLPVGSARLELLEATDAESTIARHVEKRGAGIHHLTLRVDDLDAMLAQATAHGAQVLGDGARPGAEGTRVAFLHPKTTDGVLVELVERPGAAAAAGGPSGATGRRRRGSIEPGSAVLLYLRDPQAKMWGLLQRLDPAGVVLDGIDLDSFDDWMAQVERGEESVVGPSVMFAPMSRVEKILLDRSSGHLPSLAERFERRIGRPIHEVMSGD